MQLISRLTADSRPTPDNASQIDGPEDYLRIRLACTLLDTCGVYFDRGLLRKKMDAFLAFFQMYCRSKKQPLPMDVDFMLTDTFESLRPKLALFATYEEAAKVVDEMVAKANAQGPAGPLEAITEGELDDEADEGARVRPGAVVGDRQSSEDEMEDVNGDELLEECSSVSDSSEDSESENSVSSEDEEAAAARAVQYAEEDEFERELARMMADSAGTDNRRAVATGTKSVLTEALPANLRRPQPSALREPEFSAQTSAADDSNMQFTLLLKKGSKAQTKAVSVPRGSALAMHTLSQQAKDKDEQRELKRLVLDYERREDAQSRKDWVDQAGRRGIRIHFKDP